MGIFATTAYTTTLTIAAFTVANHHAVFSTLGFAASFVVLSFHLG
jgi:hypothetical protein